MSDGEFQLRFAGTPVRRAGRARMARNAAVVLGNSRDGGIGMPVVVAALSDPDSVVRGHAAWALGRHGATGSLRRRLEISLALSAGSQR